MEVFDATKLKKEEYTIMKETDRNDIDQKLKLNTGDDEIVETIVKTAKTGMGFAGQFVNDKAIVDSISTRQPERRERQRGENLGNISKMRD